MENVLIKLLPNISNTLSTKKYENVIESKNKQIWNEKKHIYYLNAYI